MALEAKFGSRENTDDVAFKLHDVAGASTEHASDVVTGRQSSTRLARFPFVHAMKEEFVGGDVDDGTVTFGANKYGIDGW